jgi:hypothetical protein
MAWAKKQDPVSKITIAKRVGGMTPAVEYLPRKRETLSSKPSAAGKQGEKKKIMIKVDLSPISYLML